MLSTCGQFESSKPLLRCFSFQTQHRYLHKKQLLYFMYAYFLKYLL